MKIKRYIQKTLLSYVASITLIFLAIHVFINLSSQFNAIGKGQYTLGLAVQYVLLTSVHGLYLKFPFITLISSLLAIHHLYKHNEITVMRASGMSMPMLCLSICTIGAMITLTSTILGEVVAPKLEKMALKIKTGAMTGNQLMATKKGFWLHESHQFIYIKDIKSKHLLSNITRYTINIPNHTFIIDHAESAELTGKQWIFKSIQENTFSDNGVVTQQRFEKQRWEIPLSEHLIQSISLDSPDQLSLTRLQKVLQGRKKSGLVLPEQYLEFWQRIFQPLLTMAMFLFAIPFAFGPLRQSKSGFKILFGIMLGFGCYFGTYFLSTIAVLNHIPAWLSAAIPTMFILAFAIPAIWLRANQTIKPFDFKTRIKS